MGDPYRLELVPGQRLRRAGQRVAPWDVALFRFGPTDTAQNWLSGGTFGPEGSFIVTAIWLLALMVSYYYFRSGSQPVVAALLKES